MIRLRITGTATAMSELKSRLLPKPLGIFAELPWIEIEWLVPDEENYRTIVGPTCLVRVEKHAPIDAESKNRLIRLAMRWLTEFMPTQKFYPVKVTFSEPQED